MLKKFTELLYRLIFALIPDRTVRGSYRFLFLELGFKNAIRTIIKTNKKMKEKINHKYYLSIVACVKNEDLYIQEWIEYYKLMGVEHFFIYDNESTDSTKEKLQPYINQGLVTYNYFESASIKEKAQRQPYIYNCSIEQYGDTSKWMAFLDIDEYVRTKKEATLAEYLKRNEQYNQVTFQWVIFGDSFHEKHVDGLIIENYTYRGKDCSETMKSIVQPQGTYLALLHKHSVAGKSLNATCDEIQCNHYYCKSKEDFYNKKAARKSMSGCQNYDESDFNKYNQNDIIEEFSPEIIRTIKENLAKTNNFYKKNNNYENKSLCK